MALEFMTNSESTRLYGEVGGYPPARKSAYENNTQWDEYPYSLAKGVQNLIDFNLKGRNVTGL